MKKSKTCVILAWLLVIACAGNLVKYAIYPIKREKPSRRAHILSLIPTQANQYMADASRLTNSITAFGISAMDPWKYCRQGTAR